MKVRNRIQLSFIVGLILIFTSLALQGSSSSAEKYPSKEIFIVVPYTAGGPVDLSTRFVADYLQKELKVPVFVDNRPEANAIKGILDVYKANPDGYTLLANLFPRHAQMEIAYKPPYKILEMTYLGAHHSNEDFVAVNKESPFKTLKDLVEASKKKSLNCAIAGLGSRSHFDAAVLKRKVGVNLEVVPFKGTAPAMMALLGENVDLITSEALTLLLQKEKVRLLATFHEKRSRKLPEVPTLKELGYNVSVTYTLLGICGPPRLNENARKVLSDALAKVMKIPEFIDKFEKMGPAAISMSGPEFRAAAGVSYKEVEDYKDIFLESK